MCGVRRILVLIIFFVTITIFTTGAVSANNWTVNPGDNIQSIINNASANDTITVNDYGGSSYTFNENLVINKTLKLQAKTDGNVAIQALNSSIPTITINSGGSGSIIQGFIIRGSNAMGMSGIYLNGASNCTICGNNITGNYDGINSFYSDNNTIQDNKITRNSWMGINLSYLNNNVIQNNTIVDNDYGIHFGGCNNINIIGNLISGSGRFGINPQSSNATINFNSITGFSIFGIISQFNSVIDANNNWWGTNSPSYVNNVNWPSKADLMVEGFPVNYTSWLVLNITSSSDNMGHSCDSNITADLTHNNQGNDTFPAGNVPDNIPINFTTTLGTINSPVSMRKGKSVANLNSGLINGISTVSVVLDLQTISKTINVFGVCNNRTQIGYSTIQAAINDVLTLDNDTILVDTGTYTENIVVNKKLIIMAREGSTVVIQAASSSNPVFTLNPGSNGAVIQGLTIKGATGADKSGIYINGASNCTIRGNSITGNYDGINSYYSNNTTIQDNNIVNNSLIGINLSYLNNNVIRNNIIKNNDYGIHMGGCNNITVISNLISGNGRFGINPQSSNATINFNSITGFSIFGIISQFNSVIDANNNWWGTNSPSYVNNVNWPSKADLMVEGFPVTYNYWIVMNIASSSNNVSNNDIFNVTVDLTHNSAGNDTSLQGHVPDYLPVNVSSNLGIILTPAYTLNGKVNIPLIRGTSSSGTATIMVTLDYQSMQTTVQYSIFTLNSIIDAATWVKNYIETNRALPSTVSIANNTLNIAQFLYLATQATVQINCGTNSSIRLKNVNVPSSGYDNLVSGPITKVNYVDFAQRIVGYMNDNGVAPTTGLVAVGSGSGSVSYQAQIYFYSRVLAYYQINRTLPSSLIVNAWSSNNIPVTEPGSFTVNQTVEAAVWVKNYIEANNALPNTVTIGNILMNIADFLYLVTQATVQINNNSTSGLSLKNVNVPSSGYDNLVSGPITKVDYVDFAQRIVGYMNDNGVAPTYGLVTVGSGSGSVSYQAQIYFYSRVLAYYQINHTLPSSLIVSSWSITNIPITEPGAFTVNQTVEAAVWVKNYIEANNALPNTVTIGNIPMNIADFLYLATQTTVQINSNNSGPLSLKNVNVPSSGYDNLVSGPITKVDYVDFAQRIVGYMNDNGVAPTYGLVTVGSGSGSVSYQAQIYFYSRVLAYYQINHTLPSSLIVNAWSSNNIPVTEPGAFTINQTGNAAKWVKNYIEANNALPSVVTVGNISMNITDFLYLVTQATVHINNNNLGPLTLKNVNVPSYSEEQMTNGSMTLVNYVDFAQRIVGYMNDNGVAPTYGLVSSDKVGYPSQIYIYSKILDSYNTNGILPDTITVKPWTFTVSNVLDVAGKVKLYIESNHALPSSVTVSGSQMSVPQFLKLATTTLLNITSTYSSFSNYGSAPNPSETMGTGIFNYTDYMSIANNVNSYMDSNGYAPPYAISNEGNIRYESLVYIFSNILNSYNTKGDLPSLITVEPWAIISNSNTVFFSIDQVTNASSTVKSYVEANHQIPSSVTISGTQVSMPQLLELIATAVLDIGSNFDGSIVLQSYGTAPNPSETITATKNIGLIELVNVACNIRTFMNSPNNRYAPNFAYTSMGEVRYESLVYTYSKILDYHNSTGYLPENVTVNPWSIISNSNTVFFSKNDISSIASAVQSYVESYHQLPSGVIISGNQMSMATFLQLSTGELLNIAGIMCPSLISSNFNGPTSPMDDIKGGNINETEYLEIASDIINSMYNDSHAPDYAYQTSLGTHLGFQNLVYIYAQIINSYNKNNDTIPDFITVNPWSVVSNPNTIFLGMDQIVNASGMVQSYISANHALPSSVNVSGTLVTMPQFLKFATTALLNINGNLDTSVACGSVGIATNSTEDIVSGDIHSDEYNLIAQNTKKCIDSVETAPDYVYITSLGIHMGFQTLVNMYSQILDSYNINNQTLPDYVTITPWIAISNPDKIYNYRSNQIFNTIQAAIDDNNTINGDTIGLGIGTILENVIVNKTLCIMSLPTVNVTVQAANSNLPVFTIINSGGGSVIQDLNIKGATNSVGIYLNNSFYNTISDNIISGNSHGVFIYNSTNNWISDTSMLNNILNGIFISMGSDNNTVIGNILSNNGFCGINITNSNNNTVSNNIILDNGWDGIYLSNSSAKVNFNQIVGNTHYGLYNTGNGTVNALNNWWGSNTLNSSYVGINGGTVNCTQWLVLNVTSSCDRSNHNGSTYNYIISADLTHNNLGLDTSCGNGPSSGDTHNTLPDGIPVNFSTTIGTINTPVSTRNGKSVVILSSTIAGLANVTVTLDNQNLTVPVNITSINVFGIHNNRTGEGFSSIQDAINSNNTLGGDVLTLADGVYKENIVVYKTLTIKSDLGASVTVQAADPYFGVFTIMNDGSVLQNLNIVGAAYSYGVLGYANNLQITGNTMMGNRNAITLFNSKFTTISGNIITGNWYGPVLYNSTNTTISSNIITDNWYGNTLYNSTGITISGNNIISGWYGIFSNKSNNSVIYGNNITANSVGMQFYYSNSTISGNNVTGNDEGIIYYDSNCIMSGNNVTGNLLVDTLMMDTTGVVMQNNIWNCGPASLATVLNRLGVINVTQDEIASLAGTDYTGTSMAGLAYAANVKGSNQNITATGMLITNVAQLQPNNIVLLSSVSGLYHYCVITGISSTTVFLADSEIGNINMTIGNFTAAYTGYALVMANTTNMTNNTQVNGTFLSSKIMQTTKGTFLPVIIVAGLVIAGDTVAAAAIGGACAYIGVCIGDYIWNNNLLRYAGISSSGIGLGWLLSSRWNNQNSGRQSSGTINGVALGSGYGYSYSYSHGYRLRPIPVYTPYIPTVHTVTYWGPNQDGSWGLITITTTGNPDEIKNQKITDAYNQKKAQELAKITGIIESYLLGEQGDKNPDIKRGLETQKQIDKDRGIIKIPDDKDDDDRWDKVAEKLKEYGKMFKEGLAKRDPNKIIINGIKVGLGVLLVIAALTEANSEIIKELLENVNKTVKYLYITKA